MAVAAELGGNREQLPSNNSSGGAWRGMEGHGGAWRGMEGHGGAWRGMEGHGGAWMDGHGWGMAPEIQQILAIDYRKHPRF